METSTELEGIRIAIGPYVAKLAAFQTADEIRDFLVTEGIEAVAGDPHRCAVAEYAKRGSGEPVYVLPGTGIFGDVKCRGRVADITPAMFRFMFNFDAGEYPELVAS